MRYHPRGKSRRERKPNARPLHYNGRSYPRSSKPCIESHPLLWCMRSRGAGSSVRRSPLSQQVKTYVWWNGCSSAESEDNCARFVVAPASSPVSSTGQVRRRSRHSFAKAIQTDENGGSFRRQGKAGFETRPYDRHGGTVYCHGNDGLPLGPCVDGLAVGD